MSAAEQGRKMILTAMMWTCHGCPKRHGCPRSLKCFNNFLVHLKELTERAGAHEPHRSQCLNCGEVKFLQPNGLCRSCAEKLAKDCDVQDFKDPYKRSYWPPTGRESW